MIITKHRPLVTCIVMDGQSGTRGNSGGIAPPTVYRNPSNSYIRGLDNSVPTTVSSFELMDYSTGNFLGFLHSIEASLSYMFDGRLVYIIKVCQGGTNLAVDWASGSVLRNSLVSNINAAKSFFEANNINVRWIRINNQWESDCPYSTYANNYLLNSLNFHNNIISATGINIERTLIVQVNTNSDFYTNYPTNAETIKQAKINFASKIQNGILINQDDIPLHDGVHCTSGGYIELGKRCYQQL